MARYVVAIEPLASMPPTAVAAAVAPTPQLPDRAAQCGRGIWLRRHPWAVPAHVPRPLALCCRATAGAKRNIAYSEAERANAAS